jgi:hypothetical protein
VVKNSASLRDQEEKEKRTFFFFHTLPGGLLGASLERRVPRILSIRRPGTPDLCPGHAPGRYRTYRDCHVDLFLAVTAPARPGHDRQDAGPTEDAREGDR